MDSLSSTGWKSRPRRSIRRLNHLLSPPGRGLINSRGHQLYYYDHQHETPCCFNVSNPIVRLGCPNHSCPSSPVSPRFSRWHYNASNRSKPKHCFLRPCRGRRPNSLPTLILILRAPGSIYSYSSRLWNNLPHCRLLLWEKRTLRLHRNGMSHDGHRSPRLYRLSPPHVHCRHGCRHTCILYISHNNHCHPNWCKSI